MRPPRLSLRQVFEGASLLLIGLALVAIAIRLFSRFSLDFDAIAFTFWLVGCTLIGAGALCPFRRGFSGGLIGFVLAFYLLLDQATTGVDANKTFLEVAEEIAATHAESDEQSNDASATQSQQGRSEGEKGGRKGGRREKRWQEPILDAKAMVAYIERLWDARSEPPNRDTSITCSIAPMRA